MPSSLPSCLLAVFKVHHSSATRQVISSTERLTPETTELSSTKATTSSVKSRGRCRFGSDPAGNGGGKNLCSNSSSALGEWQTMSIPPISSALNDQIHVPTCKTSRQTKHDPTWIRRAHLPTRNVPYRLELLQERYLEAIPDITASSAPATDSTWIVSVDVDVPAPDRMPNHDCRLHRVAPYAELDWLGLA